jgi:hypothetical protein
MVGTYDSTYVHGFELHVGVATDEGYEAVEYIITNGGTHEASIHLSHDEAVRQAMDVLRQLDPDRLAPVPFVDLPVGTFVRRYLDGKIAQVISTPAGQEDRELQDNNNWLRFEDGSAFVAVQEADEPAWEILTDDHVLVETKAIWTYLP